MQGAKPLPEAGSPQRFDLANDSDTDMDDHRFAIKLKKLVKPMRRRRVTGKKRVAKS